MVRLIVMFCLAVGLGGCGAGSPCAPNTGFSMVVFSLFFGKAIPGRGDLTDADWENFLDETVTANLPNGYTVLDGDGAWMSPMTRKTIKEGTKVLLVALPDVPGSVATINQIRGAYQVRFRQQLVGMTVQRACGTF